MSRPLDLLAFPLQGSHLIEASAGTGKTFTIALLYVRLVLGHQGEGQPLTTGRVPPEILVMTFTEAATQELRDRIRHRLAEAAGFFAQTPEERQQKPPGADPLYDLRATIPQANWPGCVRKLQLAVEWMDEAAVSTIHSWCNRMLNEHAFDSGSFFRQALSTDQSDLLMDVLRDYWRTFVYPLTGAAASAMLELCSGPKQLQSQVNPLLDHAQRLPPQPAPEQRLADLIAPIADLKQRWQGVAEALDEQIQEAIKQKLFDGRKLQKGRWETWYQQCNDWAADPQSLALSLTEAAAKRLTPQGIEEALKKPSPLASDPAWTLLEEAIALTDRLEQCRGDLLCHASHWIAQRLQGEKQRRAEMGFQDLLTQLDEALHGPRGDHLAAIIRQQFPVALLDEFQDTDPVQYRILDRIYRIADNAPETAVVLIGDPKQAIYAFRGADIFAYLAARDATAGRHYSLPRNFRSTEPMVAAVNQLFTQADLQERGAFVLGRFHDRALPYGKVDAMGRKATWTVAGTHPPALQFWHQQALDDSKNLTKEDFRSAQASACADEIARLLNLGQAGEAGFHNGETLTPVQARDMAVLVNGRTDAEHIQQALTERGVRSVYLSHQSSVLASPQARDMLHWLQACAEPEQLSVLRSALATPTLGLSHERLEQLQLNEAALEDTIEQFRQLRRLWQRQGVLPMLRQLLDHFQVPGRLLPLPGGERALTDVLHLAEILQQESQQLDGPQALIRHFGHMLASDSKAGDAAQMRLESEASLVQVVTVHKSKGLEYPLVFLPFATDARVTTAKNTFPVQWHDSQGELQLSLTPDEEQVALADEERLGEDVRKLYVALTRAQYATYVGAGALKDWQRSGLGYLLSGVCLDPEAALNHRLEALAQGAGGSANGIGCDPVPEPSGQHYAGEPPQALGEPLTPVRPCGENWWIGSYSALSSTRGPGQSPATENQAPDSNQESVAREESGSDDGAPVSRVQPSRLPGPHSFPRGPEPGTFLHGLLEWAAHQGFAAVLQDPASLQEQIQRRCQVRGWQGWAPVLHDWMIQLLTQPLALPHASTPCSLGSLSVYRPELEFWLESSQVSSRALDQLVQQVTLNQRPRPALAPNVLNGMLKGFVDLVFAHEGRYYVLDYKSNALGPDDAAYTTEVMETVILDKRYDLQYMLYLLALHRLLKTRLPDYDYERDLGGAVYLFLRGINSPSAGIYGEKPPKAAIEALDALFRQNHPEQAPGATP
ncbi:MAG: exodeoxyribonuclease V subunit beta [Halomonadaceae bacterium]|nr:MAG: exodeoxyribonuclease V subunit beta [Halomonadaceae bacterium]